MLRLWNYLHKRKHNNFNKENTHAYQSNHIKAGVRIRCKEDYPEIVGKQGD